MADRSRVSREATERARFTQVKVKRLGSDVQKAIGHAQTRNGKVAELLCYLSLLRRAGKIGPDAQVGYIKAQRQHFSADETNDEYGWLLVGAGSIPPGPLQAAHFLPCQLTINGNYPWEFSVAPSTRSAIEGLFADVDPLPENYNKADSAAESKGLREVFRRTCERVLRDQQTTAGRKINRDLVRSAYWGDWRMGAEQAFLNALVQKRTRPGVPVPQYDAEGNITNLERMGTATDSQWNIDEQVRILQRYIESLRQPPRQLQDHWMVQLEAQFNS